MNFKEWLIKNEVAKARPKNIDISNLAIGRIGPMGTYGQDDIPSIPAWATASGLGAIGQSMRQEIGSLGSDAAARLLPLASLKDIHREGMELPLQIPVIDGKEMFSVARSSEKLVMSKILASIRGNPLENNNIRKTNETNPNMPGKFELVNQSDKDQGKVQSAKIFTEGLIKVIILYKMTNTKTVTGSPLSTVYDVQNPQVASRYYRNNHLGLVLNYTKLKNVSGDQENDYTEMEPENDSKGE
jgi:hypothetical protein